ncbi:hypothetical protein HOY82DRAFT_639973 [Tuber indicum]|nr:hypothetical protein HOY82DRAFT_639973 [Tuber indicum]
MAHIPGQHAIPVGEQPDMRVVERSLQGLSIQASRIVNIPAFDRSNEIVELLQQQNERWHVQEQRWQAEEQRWQAQEQRWQALDQRLQRLPAIEQHIRGLTQGMTAMGQRLTVVEQRLQRLPAIEQNIRELTEGMTSMRALISRNDKNGVARIINNNASRGDTPLEPFYNLDGELISDFPETAGQAMRLQDQRINALLVALDLSADGAPALRRNRFMRYIGLRYF